MCPEALIWNSFKCFKTHFTNKTYTHFHMFYWMCFISWSPFYHFLLMLREKMNEEWTYFREVSFKAFWINFVKKNGNFRLCVFKPWTLPHTQFHCWYRSYIIKWKSFVALWILFVWMEDVLPADNVRSELAYIQRFHCVIPTSVVLIFHLLMGGRNQVNMTMQPLPPNLTPSITSRSCSYLLSSSLLWCRPIYLFRVYSRDIQGSSFIALVDATWELTMEDTFFIIDTAVCRRYELVTRSVQL